MLYSPDIEFIRERVLKLIDHREAKGRPLTQSDIARAVGMSAATVSNFLNHKDLGDVPKIAVALKAYVEREESKDDGGLIKVPFVETRQAKTMAKAIDFCHRFGRMGAVLGGSGFGKSRAIEEAVRLDPSLIVLHGWNRLGSSGVLQDLCEAIKVSDKGLLRALMKRIKARLTQSERCLIVDDAHTLAFGALDTLRHIYDQTGVGVLLVGIGSLRRHLIGSSEETEQIASRVSGRLWEMPDITEDDVRLILGGVLPDPDTDQAMELLKRDPQLLSSARRLGNFIEIAGVLSKKNNGRMTVEHIRQAMRLAA
jgi:DNA transposition AAA+ family ATPase